MLRKSQLNFEMIRKLRLRQKMVSLLKSVFISLHIQATEIFCLNTAIKLLNSSYVGRSDTISTCCSFKFVLLIFFPFAQSRVFLLTLVFACIHSCSRRRGRGGTCPPPAAPFFKRKNFKI